MIHLWNLFDKIVYITKICSSPTQTSKLLWNIIVVEKHTIYSFKLEREEKIINCLLVRWVAENYHHNYAWKETYVKHNKIKSIV